MDKEENVFTGWNCNLCTRLEWYVYLIIYFTRNLAASKFETLCTLAHRRHRTLAELGADVHEPRAVVVLLRLLGGLERHTCEVGHLDSLFRGGS